MKFQTDRGLHQRPFNSFNENINIAEELLESVGLDVPKDNRQQLAVIWHDFMQSAISNKVAVIVDTPQIDYDIVDAYCDVIVFAVGAIMKLGYDPEKALLETAKEINSRVGEMKDGKFEKDLSPEARANWYKADYLKAIVFEG